MARASCAWLHGRDARAASNYGAIENGGGLTLRGFGVGEFVACRLGVSLTRFTSPDEEAEESRNTADFAGVSALGWRSAAASDADRLISWAAELSKTVEVLVTLPGYAQVPSHQRAAGYWSC